MGILSWLKSKIRRRIAPLVRREAKRVAGAEAQKLRDELFGRLPQMIAFHQSPDHERLSRHDHTKRPFESRALYAGLKERLHSLGVPVEEVDVDVADFENWMEAFSELRDYYRGREEPFGELVVEKCLEHYLTFRHLKVRWDDLCIDVAAGKGIYAEVLRKKKIRAYRLDLSYPEGVRGFDIGADAAGTGLPDGFASALFSHCAFECFAGDADTRFVREAARILGSDGRYAIAPLYIEDAHFVAVSARCDLEGVPIDPGARRVWRDDGFVVPFNRFYSPEAFKERVFDHVPPDMAGKVLYVRNLPELMERYPDQRIYCYFVFLCEKRTTHPEGAASQAPAQAGSRPDISAVVCTYNRSRYLRRAIQSLLEQSLPAERYEILVVDNGSTDGTRRLVEREFGQEPGLRYVLEPALGLSHARNAGWRNARGDYVAYLDDDAVADPGWLARILEAFRTVRPSPGCVGGKVEPIWECPLPGWWPPRTLMSLAIVDWPGGPTFLEEGRHPVGANMAFPREALEAAGGFSTALGRKGSRLLSMEENLLHRRLAQVGYRCYYEPAALVRHHVPAERLTKKWFVRRAFWQGVSVAVFRMHLESPSARERLREVAAAARTLCRPRWLAALLVPTDEPDRMARKKAAWQRLGTLLGFLGAVK